MEPTILVDHTTQFTTFMHEADRVIQWQPPQALNEIQELCDMTAHMPPPFLQKNSYKLEKERQNRQAYVLFFLPARDRCQDRHCLHLLLRRIIYKAKTPARNVAKLPI